MSASSGPAGSPPADSATSTPGADRAEGQATPDHLADTRSEDTLGANPATPGSFNRLPAGAPLPLNDDRPGLGGAISGSVPLAGPKLQETTEVAALLAEAQAALVRGDMQRATDLFKAAADAAQTRTSPAGQPAPGGGDPTPRK